MDDVGGEKAMLGGEQHKQTTGRLENGMMMLECAWGSWRGMSQRKGEEEGEKGEGKGEKKCRRITM